MSPFKTFESVKIYELNYKIFNASGFGSLENPKKWERILYSLYHFVMHVIYVSLISLFFVDAYLVRNDKEKLNLNLCTTFITAGSMAKIWALMQNFKTFLKIRQNFREDFNLKYVGWDENHKKIKEKSAKFMTRFTKLIVAMTLPLGIMWFGIPLTAQERKYCIPFPLFQDKVTPAYEIIYTFHVIVLFHFISNVLFNDLTFFGCMIRICDHFDILIDNILKIKQIYPVEKFEEYIKAYKGIETEYVKNIHKLRKEKEWRMMETKKLFRRNVVHHRMILGQLKDIENTYKGQLFIQITIGALVISVVAYNVIIQSREFNGVVIQQSLYVIIVLTDILVMCYFGTQVAEKSEEVAEALYDIPWYEMDINNRKICKFMIAKCRDIPTLKAKYIFKINLKTYLQLIKTSYNVMALLSETT